MAVDPEPDRRKCASADGGFVMSAKTESNVFPHVALGTHLESDREKDFALLVPDAPEESPAAAAPSRDDENEYVADWVI
jgi:hypothetical protein